MAKKIDQFEEIQSAIRKKKQQRRDVQFRRILKIASLVGISFFLALALFLFDRSKYSRINHLIIEENKYLSDQEVVEILKFQPGIRLYGFLTSSFEKSIPKDSLIESIKANKNWFDQSMTIYVKEKPIVGYRLTDRIELIAGDGTKKSLLTSQLVNLNGLIRLTDFSEEQLIELSGALLRADPILLSNVAEIIKDPKSYDLSYLKVMMGSGIELSTSMYSLEKLTANTYKEIVNHLGENQKCVVYDYFWVGSYSKECPK